MPKILHKFSIKNLVAPYIIVNFILLAAQALYIFTRYKYINSVIPLWLTKPWGDMQLADKTAIYYLPAIALALTIFGLVLILISRKYFIRYFSKTVFAFVTFSNIMIFYSIFRIILVASVPFDHLINPHVLNLAIPFLTAFLLAYFFVPVFIDYAKENNVNKIWLWTQEELKDAIRLYEKKEFVFEGRQKNQFCNKDTLLYGLVAES